MLAFGCANQSKEKEEKIDSIETLYNEFRVSEKYSQKELEGLDSAELRIKRNEIFAQYGYKFKSAELKKYFSSKPWYKAKYDNVDSLLTDLDRSNINKIASYEEEYFKAKSFDCKDFSNELSSFYFKSSITQTIDSLGTPDSTFIHEHITCLIGQLHYWHNDFKNYQLIVLGDSYSTKKDYSASSRYYAFKVYNKSKTSDFSFNNIKLEEPETLVKQKLECIVNANTDFSLSTTEGNSIVEVFYIENQLRQYLISNKELYIRFIISNDEKLVAIVFATFNDHLAC